MYRDTAYLLPALLALAHFTSAIPAPLAPRAAGGTNPILPRATGNLPVDGPESSPIQISYALAPAATPVAPQPVEPAPILDPILSEAVDQDEFYRRQIENVTDSGIPPPPPDNETSPGLVAELVSLGILPFEKRAPAPTPPATAYLQPDATTITVASFQTPPAEAPPASVDLASYLGQLASLGFFPPIAKRAPVPTAPASDYAPTEVVTVSDVPFQTPVPAAPPAETLIPELQSLGLLLPYAKREALAVPPDSYLNGDVNTVFAAPTPPPAAATPLPSESIIPYLQSLGLLLPYAKREALPTPPPDSYIDTDVTTVFDTPTPPPAAATPLPTESIIPYLQSLGLLLPYAKREALPTPPPDSYLNPDVTTVFDTPTPPPAAAPLPTESIIPYLQSLGLLLPYAKREALPTPPAASYAPTDITTVSDVPVQTPIPATPTQPLASIVLESYIPELVSLGVIPFGPPAASPTPSNAYNKRQDDPNGAGGDWLIPPFPTQVLQSWEGLGPAVTPAPTVVGVSEAGAEPTVMGVSAAWRA